MKRILAVMVVLSLCATAHAELTLAKYNRIRKGMTYSQATAILGSPSKQASDFQIGENRSTVYQWNGKDENSAVILGFYNDRVETVMQIGLE